MPIWLLQLLGGIVLNLVVTLAQQAFAPKPAERAGPTTRGMRGQASFGGTTPLRIVLGTYGVAGHLEYRNTSGNSGETPNAYLTDVISLSDMPISAVTARWLNSEPVTITTTGHVDQGFPIPEKDVSGVNHAWADVSLGDQSTADAFLLARFGSDADRPWLSDMVGEGIAFFTATALVNDDLWTGFPTYMHELQGKPLYNPRKDTTAGGSGSHRWGTPATYEFSDNNAVLIYNILRGLYDADGNHIWGGHATAYQLPYDVWAAAMDRCDDDIDLDAGGTEKRYRAGIEISVNERPADVIKELLIGCNGRIAQAQGRYYILVDVPDTADGSFTDADMLVTQETTQQIFPNLDNVVNGAAATYLEPQQAWEGKETAPYYRADLETEDDNRRLLEPLDLRAVFSGTQAQRILKAVVEESRRFRRHVVPFPPQFGVYRPLQVLSWTSELYGYTDKLFLITSKTEDEWGNIALGLQEIDPADFDWDESVDETALSFAPLTPIVAPSQAVAGWAVEPYTDGRLPGLHMEWVGALQDIRAAQILIRRSGEILAFFDREFTYDREHDTQDIYILGDPLIRNTVYEVSARWLPPDGSGRPMAWTSWYGVTTPDVAPEIAPGSVGNTELNRQLRDAVGFITDGGVADLEDRILDALDRVAGTHVTSTMAADRDVKLVSVAVDGVQAAVVQEAIARANADSALSTFILDVAAQAASGLAEGLFTVSAESAPSGVAVRLALLARVTTLDTYVDTGMLIDLISDGAGGYDSRIIFKAESIFFTDGSTVTAPMVFQDGILTLNVANIGTVTAGLIRDPADTFRFDLANGIFYRVDGTFLVDAKNRRIRMTKP